MTPLLYEKQREEIEYFVSRIERQKQKQRLNRFTNFKITFTLSSPICITTPWLNFDSLIGHLMTMESLDREYFVTDKKINLAKYVSGGGLPYGSLWHEEEGLAVPTVSVGYSEDPFEPRVEVLYKRFEGYHASFKGKIRVGSGHFRNFMIHHIYIPIKKVTFFVKGDKEFIYNLLKRNLFALGNDVRVGYGFIKNMSVRDMEKDYSIVMNGKAMRPLPVELCESYEEVAPLPYKPPYWEKRNVRMCVPPFTRCELKEKWRRYYG